MDVKISFTVNGKARTVVTAVAHAVFHATGKSVQALTGKAGGVNLSRVQDCTFQMGPNPFRWRDDSPAARF